MIVGLGVEMIDLDRFRSALARRGPALLERLFTEGERAYAAGRTRGLESLAARFAAKAAARRALGGGGIGWREVEVVRERGRAPELRLHGRAAEAARRRGAARTVLTLAHDPPSCIGQVVLESA